MIREVAPDDAERSSDVSADEEELAPGSAGGSVGEGEVASSGSAVSVDTGTVDDDTLRENSAVDVDTFDSAIGGGTDTSMKTSSEYFLCF